MDAWIAAVASFLGGAGFSGVLKYFTTNRQMKLSNEQALRAELQDQLEKMNARISQLEADVNHWRDKYLELYKAHADLQALVERKRNTRTVKEAE